LANLALGRAWHGRRRLPNVLRLVPNLGWLIGRKQLIALLILATVVVEGLLGLRFFVQITGNYSPAVMKYSEPLVSPFKEYEPSYSEKATGVFEYSTVLAAEVYLVIAAALVTWLVFTPVLISIVKSFIWGIRMTFLAARRTDAGMSFVVERYRVRERIRAAIMWPVLTLAAFVVWTWQTTCRLAVALDAWAMRKQRQIAGLSVRMAVWCKRTAIRTALAMDAWAMRRQQQITEGSVRTASWTKRTVMSAVLAIDAGAMRTQKAIGASARFTWMSACGITRGVDSWFLAVQHALPQIAGACLRAIVSVLLWPVRMLVRVARAIVWVLLWPTRMLVRVAKAVDAALLNIQHGIGSFLHFVAVRPARAAVSKVRFANQAAERRE
jgi:hypothetical protein